MVRSMRRGTYRPTRGLRIDPGSNMALIEWRYRRGRSRWKRRGDFGFHSWRKRSPIPQGNLRGTKFIGMVMEWNGLWGGLKKWLQVLENKVGGQGRNRTADASLFRAALYRLSYLAATFHSNRRPLYFAFLRPRYTTSSAASSAPVAFSTSACKLLPCASMVTIAANPFTRSRHIASGIPNSIRYTPGTSSTVRA